MYVCMYVCMYVKFGERWCEMINRPLMDRLADASALNAHWMFAVSSECIVAIIQLARQCTPPNTRYSPWETRSLPCSMRIKKERILGTEASDNATTLLTSEK